MNCTLEQGISIPDLARLWSVHPRTIRRWISSGELNVYRVGKRQRVTVESAEAFVRRQNENGPE